MIKNLKRSLRDQTFLGCKRGSTWELVLLVSLVLIIGIAFPLISNAQQEIGEELLTDLNSTGDISNETVEFIETGSEDVPGWFDDMFTMFFFGAMIVSIVSAYFVKAHPIFLVASILGVIVLSAIGADTSNAYEEVFTDEELVDQVDLYPKMYWISTNLVQLLLVAGLLITIALFLGGDR